MYMHDLAWNGHQWWVTTYRAGEAVSGMPLDMFLREHYDRFLREYPTFGKATE